MPNAGATILIFNSSNLLDTFAYPAAQEGISFERRGDEIIANCVPTPGALEAVDWNPDLQIESGNTSGFNSVSLNIRVIGGNGSMTGAQCSIDFGDERTSTSCNPSSHTYSTRFWRR